LNNDILQLILQAENEYHAAMKNVVAEVENYADEYRKRQNAYIEDLKREWHLFEKSENDKFTEMLAESEKKLDAKMTELKKQLNVSKKKKADLISERLKKEVVSLYGGC